MLWFVGLHVLVFLIFKQVSWKWFLRAHIWPTLTFPPWAVTLFWCHWIDYTESWKKRDLGLKSVYFGPLNQGLGWSDGPIFCTPLACTYTSPCPYLACLRVSFTEWAYFSLKAASASWIALTQQTLDIHMQAYWQVKMVFPGSSLCDWIQQCFYWSDQAAFKLGWVPIHSARWVLHVNGFG